MKRHLLKQILLGLALYSGAALASVIDFPYEGRLDPKENGVLDVEFNLYQDGSKIDSATYRSVRVVNGLFHVDLRLDVPRDGQTYLEVRGRDPGSSNAMLPLFPIARFEVVFSPLKNGQAMPRVRMKSAATTYTCAESTSQISCGNICGLGVVQQVHISRPPPGASSTSCTVTSHLGTCSTTLSYTEAEPWGACCVCQHSN